MANMSKKIVVWVVLVATIVCICAAHESAVAHNNNINNHNNDINACPSVAEAVFPYWSICFNPATYHTPYFIESQGAGTQLMYLAPEWDESNSTYYVRLVNGSEGAASYSFSYFTRELRPFIGAGDLRIVVTNTESGRYLSWREEGGQYFLIESEYSDAIFSFAYDGSVNLACPLILHARCAAYNLISSSDFSLGLAPYEEDSAVYFQLASSNIAPFVLRIETFASSHLRQSIDV
jgi:hypothetical protein